MDDALALNRSEKTDVAIVGSGIAGTWVAYELARAGTWWSLTADRWQGHDIAHTAHVTAQCDDGFHRLIGRRGRRWPSSVSKPGRLN